MPEKRKPARKVRLLKVTGANPRLLRRLIERKTKRLELPGDCGIPAGWVTILRRAVLDLDALAVRRGLDLRISDVKEKWGELRITLDEWPEEADPIIEEAEEESSFSCAACGRPGAAARVGGRVLPLCRLHRMLGEIDGSVKRK